MVTATPSLGLQSYGFLGSRVYRVVNRNDNGNEAIFYANYGWYRGVVDICPRVIGTI